jgi:hypothetical protein
MINRIICCMIGIITLSYAGEITHISVESGPLAHRFAISSSGHLYALHFPQAPYTKYAHGSLDLFFPYATITDAVFNDIKYCATKTCYLEFRRIIKPVPGVKAICTYDKKLCHCSFRPDVADPHQTIIIECINLSTQKTLNDAYICSSYA